jgi:hypothetical protein
MFVPFPINDITNTFASTVPVASVPVVVNPVLNVSVLELVPDAVMISASGCPAGADVAVTVTSVDVVLVIKFATVGSMANVVAVVELTA